MNRTPYSNDASRNAKQVTSKPLAANHLQEQLEKLPKGSKIVSVKLPPRKNRTT